MISGDSFVGQGGGTLLVGEGGGREGGMEGGGRERERRERGRGGGGEGWWGGRETGLFTSDRSVYICDVMMGETG